MSEPHSDAQVRAVATFFEALAEVHPCLPQPAANDALVQLSA